MGFYSGYFLIPKAKRRLRPILDVCGLNWYLKAKISYGSLDSIIPSLDLGDWYATLDLKDAYFHVSIVPAHRRFLCFVLGSSHYQFKVLLFGMLAAPTVFTKCMAVVAVFLKRSEVQMYPYLNDWLIKGLSTSVMDGHMELVKVMFCCLGLLLNMQKSTLASIQVVHSGDRVHRGPHSGSQSIPPSAPF